MSAEEMAEAMYPESEITYGCQAVREAFEYGYAAARLVQPSREDVARLLAHQNADWLHGYLGADPATGETHDHGPRCSNWEPYVEDADAVLALFAQQPTVAEVKAEALREAAVATNRPASGAPYEVWAWCSDWLRDRADRIEREARP